MEGLRIEARLGGTARTIVRALELEVGAGETVGIVGESGSGKSLTARALIGLLPPGVHAGGEITFDGRNLLSLGERSLRRIRGRKIALLLQDPYTMLNPLLRIGTQIMETAPKGRGRDEPIRRLAEVGIHDPRVAEQYPFQLSGGMQQRVAIAAALASDPELLIADEPSTALDVTTQMEILALLRRVQEARGMGLVLITHDLRVAFSICQRIYVLYAGSVLEAAPGADLEREPLHPYTLGPASVGAVRGAPARRARRDRGRRPRPGRGRRPLPVRTRGAGGRRRQCSAGDPPLREVARGTQVGLRAHRRDPRRARWSPPGTRRAHARSRRACREGGRLARPSRGSEEDTTAGCAAEARSRRSRVSRSRSARGERRHRRRVGLGEDDARAVPGRPRDADVRDASSSTASTRPTIGSSTGARAGSYAARSR